VSGHKEVCKYLFTIQVLGDDESDLPDEAGDLTISLHALTGIQPSSGKTMQLHILVNGVVLTALLDSSSTHNFVDTDTAARAGIQLRGASGLRVAVANGDRVHNPGCYKALHFTVAGEPFDIDIYGLALGSFDVVLGVQWLESLGPVLWDFTKRTIAFIHGGRRVHWYAAGTSPPPPSIATTKGDFMAELLQGFDDVFHEPTGLPPPRLRQHRICLLPGTVPVAVRPYRYAHVQKGELERQCADMMAQGVIRPSTSVFSAPVILVKKSDNSWRLCVDYHALNTMTVKDKFPIPVVEELLDELRGVKFFTELDLQSGYHQVRMHPDDIEKTAFRTHQGLFEFLVMPFGLTNAPVTFQALMKDVLGPFLRRFVLVFSMTYSSTTHRGPSIFATFALPWPSCKNINFSCSGRSASLVHNRWPIWVTWSQQKGWPWIVRRSRRRSTGRCHGPSRRFVPSSASPDTTGVSSRATATSLHRSPACSRKKASLGPPRLRRPSGL
jgi:hypothetical protein